MRVAIYIWCCWMLAGFSVYGQAVLRGKVIDRDDQKPLPFANVFISNTTIGAATNQLGEFELRGIPYPADYELIVSFVGYELGKFQIQIRHAENTVGPILLAPSDLQLGQVEVSAERDTDFEKFLPRFQKYLLGTDALAKSCKILNPWVLEFEQEGKWLTAKAEKPLEIDNYGLGYKITLFLTYFSASPTAFTIRAGARFEEMTAANDMERETWAVNRKKMYARSRQNLFRAIVRGRIREERFRLYREVEGSASLRSDLFSNTLNNMVRELDTTRLFFPSIQPGIYRIQMPSRVEVHFTGERARSGIYKDVRNPVGWITLAKGFVLVNEHGYELNPSDVQTSGYFSEARVAHWLPTNLSYERRWSGAPSTTRVSQLVEQIYVHTDRSYYYPGDRIWFRGFVNYAEPELQDSLSRTVYVEVIDSLFRQHSFQLLRLSEGKFSGVLDLPATIDRGTYYLRAYTKLNLNFGKDAIHVKPIPVIRYSDAAFAPALVENSVGPLTVSIHDQPADSIIVEMTYSGAPVDSTAGASVSISVIDEALIAPCETSRNILAAYPIRSVDSTLVPLRFPIEYGVSFRGRLVNKKGRPINATAQVFDLQSGNMAVLQADTNGEFTVSGLVFFDTASFVFRPYGKKLENSRVTILPDSIPRSNLPPVLGKLEVKPASAGAYKPSRGVTMLNEVKVYSDRLPEEFQAGYRQKRPYGKPDYVVKGSELNTSYGNLLQTLPGRVPGLIIRQATQQDGQEWIVYIARGINSSVLFPRQVQVMVNDVPISGKPGDILSSINVADVESVEVNVGINVMYGSFSGFGIVSVYTRKVLPEAMSIAAAFPTASVKGYDRPVIFTKAVTEASVGTRDFEPLIYWNPDIQILPQRPATIKLPRTSWSSRYRVIIEGVDAANNSPLRVVRFIDVAPK